MSLAPSARRLSRFDLTVLGVAAGAALLILLLIWRGDQVGLEAVTVTPADGSAGVSTRGHIVVEFDQPLADGAVSVSLDPPAAGQTIVDGATVTFVPESLAPDTLYRARIAPGVSGANGRTLTRALEWGFATGRAQALFTRVVDGKEQLFTTPLPQPGGAGSNENSVNQITDAASGIWDFTVSPADGRIAYSALTDAGTSDLWALAPGAAAPEQLLACPNAFCSSPSWSQDGELLLFSQRNANDFGAAAVNPPRLYIMHVASGETAPVFSDSQKLGFEARWANGGQWITYLSPDFVGIGVYNLESGDERFYPTQTGEAAVWRPGATQFVMNEQRVDGDRVSIHLFLVDPIADTRVNLSGETSPVEDGAPVWSPDGEWIAFRRNINDGPGATLSKQLWIMRADGSDARPLTDDGAIDHGPPAWSPDGRYLLYHRFPLKGPDIVISVWLMDVATGEQWQVISPGQRPQWLP
ncbi:MAG: Ig-like domain-containing protein [Caldilinea sp.]|nr:PD40 domain-containing protein [Caldilinea sp.]MCB9117361.1 PD40 domain-containing protein [Caldilineaceae bacterium]MCB9121278.1 PD40 domain-containing protein [Caldilineaceae bacterium]MCB9125277.1 PD40 domain-containing protein [Caldilineaceae bacterium]MCO5210401.1 Ig-like domain-containing protein [Caldilinea sp.]